MDEEDEGRKSDEDAPTILRIKNQSDKLLDISAIRNTMLKQEGEERKELSEMSPGRKRKKKRQKKTKAKRSIRAGKKK